MSGRGGMPGAKQAQIEAERTALLQRQVDLARTGRKALVQASGNPAAKAAARDEFINRLQQEQAEQQARLEALKAGAFKGGQVPKPAPAATPTAQQPRVPAQQTRGLEQAGGSLRPTGGRRPVRQMHNQEVDEFLEFARSLRGDSAVPRQETAEPAKAMTQRPHRPASSAEGQPEMGATLPGQLPGRYQPQGGGTVPGQPVQLQVPAIGVPMQQGQPFYGGQPYMGATWRGPQNQLMGDQLPPALQQTAYSQQVADHLKALQDLLQTQLAAEQAPKASVAPQLPAANVNDLPATMQKDSEMQALHDAHIREMTKLSYELERAKTATELAQMRYRMKQLGMEPPPLPPDEDVEPKPASPAGESQPPPPRKQRWELEDEQEKKARRKPERYRAREQSEDESGSSDSEGESAAAAYKRRRQKQKEREREEAAESEGEESEGETEAETVVTGVKVFWPFWRSFSRTLAQLIDRQLGPEREADSAALNETYRVKDLWLEVEVMSPVSMAGSYSAAVVLYDGSEPVQAAGTMDGVRTQTTFKEVGQDEMEGTVLWKEQLCLERVRLRSTSQVVVEVHHQKEGSFEPEMIAWAHAPIMQKQDVVTGLQSVPVYRLPLMLSAARKFSFDNAFLDFSLADHNTRAAAAAAEAQAASAPLGPDGKPLLAVKPPVPEDVKGVATAAWAKVKRGVPPSEAFKPGEGFAVLVDAARFLPGNVTLSKVVGSVWSYDRQLLCPPFEALCTLESDALMPTFACQMTLGVGAEKFTDPTATLLLQIDCVERDTQQLRCAGYAAINLFVDPRENSQPKRKNLFDYVLNQGGWQIPLHTGPPDREDPTFHAESLAGQPRVTCASLLIRIMKLDAARLAARRKLPNYADRAYDSSRDFPTATERRVYGVLMMRDPVRIRDVLKALLSPADTSSVLQQQQQLPPNAGPAQASGTPQSKRSSIFGGARWGTNKTAVPLRAAPSLLPAQGEAAAEAATEPELQPEPEAPRPDDGPLLPDEELVEVMQAGVLCFAHPSEGRLQRPDSIADALHPALQARLQRPELWNDIMLDYCRGWPYSLQLGFHVSLDSCSRLPRNLPVAAVFSLSPPGAFYQDLPRVDAVGVTLQYDMDARLNAPTWLDGYQQFKRVRYDPALALIVDIRTVLPGSGATAPVGWAALPIFESGPGRYVASGYYQLPLFQGLPSREMLDGMASAKDVHTALRDALKTGRLKYISSYASVLVRLCDEQRMGHLQHAAWSGSAKPYLRLPPYVKETPRVEAELKKSKEAGRTYDNARAKDMSADMWLQDLNDAIVRAVGLDQLGKEPDLNAQDLTEGEKEMLQLMQDASQPEAAAAP